uniref:Uncharacterized protein n=1 Tax=Anguilla anguilla TaxID=7936 RepID=A0A0E9X6Q8_ANGAN
MFVDRHVGLWDGKHNLERFSLYIRCHRYTMIVNCQFAIILRPELEGECICSNPPPPTVNTVTNKHF